MPAKPVTTDGVIPVTTRGGKSDYTFENLGIPEYDSDHDINEETFHMSANEEGWFNGLRDGHSGRHPIDTSFENYSEEYVNAPRSDRDDPEIYGQRPNHEGVDSPAPVQVNRHKYPHRLY